MRSVLRVPLLAAATTLVAGAAPGPPPILTVFAAASLTDAFTVLGRELERMRPGTRVQFNFAGSQQLALQMEQGAAADVFASADQRWMSYARQHRLIEGEPFVFAHNRLVVIVPRSNPARLGRLEDLSRRGVKLVVAAEAVPAGKYTREALANLSAAPGFPMEYLEKVLGNVVSEEDNVKGAVAKVQLGEADAGVAYRSDVTSSVARQVRVFDIPDPYNVVASYPIAVAHSSVHADAARAFVDLIQGPVGQRVLVQYGFIPARNEIEAAPASRP
jgi:molybdate transport system substrate-binding protein